MNVQLRPAALADAPALSALLEALGYPGTAPFIEGRLAQLAAHPDAAVWVAQDDSGVLGIIAVHFIAQLALAGDFCRISYLCVADTARGRGIGAQLEARAVAEARRRGCDRVELHCHERRRDAHLFYARLGYEESPKYLRKSLLSD